MPVNRLQKRETTRFQTLEQVGAAKAHQSLASAPQVIDLLALGGHGGFFGLRLNIQTQAVARYVQGVDAVHYRWRVQAGVAVVRIGIADAEGDRQRFAQRKVAPVFCLAVLAGNKAAAFFVGFGVVLQDKTARAPHHVQSNQLAPIVKFFAFFNRQNRVHAALEFALKVGFCHAGFAHEVLGADADVGLFINKQPQLRGQVGLGFVVRRGGQQDDFGVALFDVVCNGFVAPPFAVAQVMAFVNQHQPIALEAGQLFDLRHRQHHTAQAVVGAVVLPHGFEVFGANDQCFIAHVVLKHPRQRGRHDGFSQPDHVANHHAAAPVQVAGSNFDGAFLELKQLLLKARRQAKLAQSRPRFGAQVVGHVEVDVVRRNHFFARPAVFNQRGQVGRNIQRPALAPARFKPLRQFSCAQVVEHIDIQLPMARQAGQRQIAAADKAGDGVVHIVAEQQIQLGVQRVRQKQLDHHLPRAQLPSQAAQPGFVLAGGNAQRDLLAQVGGKLGFQAAGGGVVNMDMAGFGFIARVTVLAVPVQRADVVVRRALHSDHHAADLALRGLPRRNQVVNRLPAAQIQITHAKISALRNLQSRPQRAEQVLFYVVKNTGHEGCAVGGLWGRCIVPFSPAAH